MTGVALVLVLVSAFLHACWNYLAKTSLKKIVFIWWFLLLSAIAYFPMFLYFRPEAGLSRTGWLFVLATGFLHFLYFYFLGMAYERGDLSLVYPVSRGAAPMLVPVAAALFLGETVSPIGGTGIFLVVAGLYVIHLKGFSGRNFGEPLRALRNPGSVWAALTGIAIAGYSLVDKAGVAWVHPPVYIYLMGVLTWLLLTPFVLARHRSHILPEWRTNGRAIVLVALLVMASYLLILFAMQTANIGYIIAAREISIVFSVLFGLYRLGEKHGLQKLTGAILITTGVVCIGSVS